MGAEAPGFRVFNSSIAHAETIVCQSFSSLPSSSPRPSHQQRCDRPVLDLDSTPCNLLSCAACRYRRVSARSRKNRAAYSVPASARHGRWHPPCTGQVVFVREEIHTCIPNHTSIRPSIHPSIDANIQGTDCLLHVHVLSNMSP